MSVDYLFVFREGTTALFTVDGIPTPHDVEAVRCGTIDIVRLRDLRRMDGEGRWLPLDAGALTSVVADGQRIGPFHMPGSML